MGVPILPRPTKPIRLDSLMSTLLMARPIWCRGRIMSRLPAQRKGGIPNIACVGWDHGGLKRSVSREGVGGGRYRLVVGFGHGRRCGGADRAQRHAARA